MQKMRLFHLFALEIRLIKNYCNQIGCKHFGPHLRKYILAHNSGKSGSAAHNFTWVTTPRKHQDRRMWEWIDGRTDRPYFIGPFRLPPGVQKHYSWLKKSILRWEKMLVFILLTLLGQLPCPKMCLVAFQFWDVIHQ